MSNLPSVRTLETAFPGKGKALRKALEDTGWMMSHPAAINLVKRSYGIPSLHERRLAVLDAILEGHGVESVHPGTRKGETHIEYINMGDLYNTTLLYKHAYHRFAHIDCDAWCGGRWIVSDVAKHIENRM